MKTRYAAIAVALMIVSAGVASLDAGEPANWEQTVRQRLPLYGHRNWIVIADSAYPAQTRDGIETIMANADQLTVLREVLQQISSSRHVRPIVYTDSELAFLTNEEVPGISSFRQSLSKALAGHNATPLPHEQIISKLDQAAQLFRVLIIKTNSTLPYTTTFLQLDCAYWGQDAEQKLRADMVAHHK